MKKFFMAAVALLSLLGVASAMSSPLYILNWSVMGGGGGSSGSTNFVMGGTIGQSTGQVSSSTSYSVQSGFWPSSGGPANITNKPDEIGIYQSGAWYLDTAGTGNPATSTFHYFGGAGWTPVVGDWNGDGKTEIGIYHDGAWYLDLAGTGIASTATFHYFGAPGWTPVIGKWS